MRTPIRHRVSLLVSGTAVIALTFGLAAVSPVHARTPLAAASTVASQQCGPGAAWVGLFGTGVVCLDAGGWKVYDKTNSAIRIGQTHDIAICPDGRTWIADSGGLVSTDGRTWTKHGEQMRYFSVAAVACGKGGVWLVGYNTVGFFDGTTLTEQPITALGKSKFVNMPKDVAVGPDGRVWVVTTSSVAVFDGSGWTYWEKGRGFTKDMFFEAITLDRKNVPWLVATSGVFRLAGGTWRNVTPSWMTQPKPIAVDLRNRVWVGTYSKGLAVYNGKAWARYTAKKGGLPSNNIRRLAVDAAGRIWVGTDWGLSVMSGAAFTTYHMHDSALTDNDIYALAVEGRGPALAKLAPKANGTLTGRLVKSGSAQSGLKVEVCVQFVGGLYSGATPCSDQVFHQLTTTDGSGRFTFTLPVGRYALVFRNAAGKWVRLTDGYKIGDRQMLVAERGTFDMGDIDIATSS